MSLMKKLYLLIIITTVTADLLSYKSDGQLSFNGVDCISRSEEPELRLNISDVIFTSQSLKRR